MIWLQEIEDDYYRALKMLCSIMCGLLTGMSIAFDWCNINYTNALGRHFQAWYQSAESLFDYFVGPLNVVVLDITGHLLIQALFVFLVFTWWYVPFWMARWSVKLMCWLATYNIRPFRKKGITILELCLILTMALVAFAAVVTRDCGVPFGTWVDAVAQPISRKIAPMFDMYLDWSWTLYVRQVIKYLLVSAIWLLWWVPAVLVLELITIVPVIEIRRIRSHEPIQDGDDGVGCV